jgi:chromosome segregation ATPase
MGGETSCPNASRIREDELMAEIKRYFSDILKGRDSLIEAVSAELKKAAHLGSSKNEKIRIQTELANLKRQFRKQEEKFDEELITMSELKERVRPIRKRMNDLEARLEAIENSPGDENYVKSIIQNIYTGVGELLNLSEWSNAQVKRVIEKITVNEKGEVTVYLKPLRRLGLESPISIGVRESAGINGKETQNISEPESNALNKNADNVRYINFTQTAHNGDSQPARCGISLLLEEKVAPHWITSLFSMLTIQCGDG